MLAVGPGSGGPLDTEDARAPEGRGQPREHRAEKGVPPHLRCVELVRVVDDDGQRLAFGALTDGLLDTDDVHVRVGRQPLGIGGVGQLARGRDLGTEGDQIPDRARPRHLQCRGQHLRALDDVLARSRAGHGLQRSVPRLATDHAEPEASQVVGGLAQHAWNDRTATVRTRRRPGPQASRTRRRATELTICSTTSGK